MGSDYAVVCTNYMVYVCVQCLVLKNTFQKLYQFAPKYKVQEAPIQLGPTERAIFRHLYSDWEQLLTMISFSSHKKEQSDTNTAGSHTKWSCPCARYEG
jgi:hypothetical protein